MLLFHLTYNDIYVQETSTRKGTKLIIQQQLCSILQLLL